MIKHNAVCACSDFSEENRVLAIKKSRIYFIHDEWSGWHWFGWFLAVVFFNAIAIGAFVGWYFKPIFFPKLVCNKCQDEIPFSQLR